tara:strand:+ start:1039 stop:1239 length:201 start_codon:yes stop_codon:yes gene_type:complete
MGEIKKKKPNIYESFDNIFYDIDKLKLKPVKPDMNQRNTRVFKKKTVDLMMKIKKQNEDRSKLRKK